MDLDVSTDGAVVLVKPREKALLQPLDPPALDALSPPGEGAAVVALDLSGVEFVSGLFLEACVALGRDLAERDRVLVLLGLTDTQREVLAAIEGGSRVPVLRDEHALSACLDDLLPGSLPDGGGVGSAEKNLLWN